MRFLELAMGQKKLLANDFFWSKDSLNLRNIINKVLFFFTLVLFVQAIREISFTEPIKFTDYFSKSFLFRVSFVVIGSLYLVRSIFF